MRTQNLNMCVFFDYFEIMSIIKNQVHRRILCV